MNMKLSLRTLLIALGLMLGCARVLLLAVEISPFALNCFKDAAHIHIGAIGLVAWQEPGALRKLFWALCVVEVACAIISKI